MPIRLAIANNSEVNHAGSSKNAECFGKDSSANRLQDVSSNGSKSAQHKTVSGARDMEMDDGRTRVHFSRKSDESVEIGLIS